MPALNQIIGAMDDIDSIMKRHLKDYIQVPRRFTPYDPKEWNDLLKQVHRDFGRPAERWAWMIDPDWQRQMVEDPEWRGVAENEWHVIFYFKHKADAVLFGLKY